jgi:hypothetical protein
MALSELFRAQEKGKTCISIIIPPDNKPSKTIEKVEGLLVGIYSADEMRKVLTALHKLAEKLVVNQQGIGIYITEGFARLVRFPFMVKDKIHIGESFWIRELISLDYYTVNYYVLELSEDVINLYKGRLNKLERVEDKRFPYSLEQYAPAFSGNVQIYDALTLNKNRLKNYMLAADNKLCHYLGEKLLVLAGPEKHLIQFREVTNHWTHVAGNITSSDINDVWFVMRDFLDNHKEVLANEWLAKRALHKISDIREIWRAAVAGKGLILMVEKDYSLSAYQESADGRIHIKPPDNTYRIISDVVNEIMKIVLEEDGEVIIVKNGSLDNYHRMVLLTE